MRLWAIVMTCLFLSVPSRARQHTQPECEGPICTADVFGFVSGGWTVSYTKSNGRGDGDEPCDPCKKCKAILIWSYSGSCTFVVVHGEDFTAGGGPGSGVITLKTDCDDAPDGASAIDDCGGSFSADLFCPCG